MILTHGDVKSVTLLISPMAFNIKNFSQSMSFPNSFIFSSNVAPRARTFWIKKVGILLFSKHGKQLTSQPLKLLPFNVGNIADFNNSLRC